MADISNNFVGIRSPNPFWLASAPPTDKEYNVVRAFKEGGAAWFGDVGRIRPSSTSNGPRASRAIRRCRPAAVARPQQYLS